MRPSTFILVFARLTRCFLIQAILSTLTILLTRVPAFVKPFYPQLQRTFVKSLSDASSSVRNRAAAALGVLFLHQPRIEAIITELTNLASSEQGEVRDAVVVGLANIVSSGGANLPDVAKSAIMDLINEAFAESNKGTNGHLKLDENLLTFYDLSETYNQAIAKLFGSLAQHDIQLLEPVISSHLVGPRLPTQLSSATILSIIELAPQALYDLNLSQEVVTIVLALSNPNQAPAISRPAREAKEAMKALPPWSLDDAVVSRL